MGSMKSIKGSRISLQN